MKTPDKIFVSADPFGFMYAHDIKDYPSCAEEYIRKDALLDWLNGLIKDCENSNSYVLGLTSLAYQDVINKIESL